MELNCLITSRGEDRTKLDNTNNSINDQKENDLNCAGCIYLDEECAPCASCVRSVKYADYYRQAPEKDWLEYKNPSEWQLTVTEQNIKDITSYLLPFCRSLQRMLIRSGQLRFAAGRRRWDMPIFVAEQGHFIRGGKHFLCFPCGLCTKSPRKIA